MEHQNRQANVIIGGELGETDGGHRIYKNRYVK
jgi:hypothetical protein